MVGTQNRKVRRRGYESPLRQEQHQATRARIADAMLDEVRDGADELSAAKIARRARVSIPTVYRHFSTRADMLRGLQVRVHEILPPPAETGDFATDLRAFFTWREASAAKLGSAIGSPLIWELRREVTVPQRRAHMQRLVDARVPNLAEPERGRLIDLLVVLVSDTTASAFRGYLGLGASEAADRVLYAVETLIAAARRQTDGTEGKRKRGPA